MISHFKVLKILSLETAEDEAKLQTFPDHFLAVYSSLYMGTRVEIGHQIVDLVESCVFKSFDCKARLTTCATFPIRF